MQVFALRFSESQQAKQMHSNIVTTPRVDIDPRLDDENIFEATFGNCDEEEWLNVLIKSIDEGRIQGVEFPSFPPPELQSQIHGHFGQHSLVESAQFYNFVARNCLHRPASGSKEKGYLLDFGSGWGRIVRMFMREFPLRNIIGYEPSNRFCSIARTCNPFISFLSGGYLPDGVLPEKKFTLVTGWSVFSHLSRDSAEAWLEEFQRITAPGAYVAITTWGRRFLERLKLEKAESDKGNEIHWYSRVCLDACSDIDDCIRAYEEGEFVWFTSGKSTLYGEAFMSKQALVGILGKMAPDLSLRLYDNHSLPQDIFILQKAC